MAKAPERIGRYEIEAELGRGGMGVVYRARDTVLDRRVALKRILENVRFDEEGLKRFQREARAAATLHHPSIVAIHEIGFHEDRPFIVMELIEGESFEALLARGELSLEEIVGIVRETALALDHAHEQKIVHRDVKPENILVTTSKDDRTGATVRLAHLTDFGLARRVTGDDRITEAGDIVGTLPFMGPEQLGDETEAGPPSDVHALGAVLYRAFTGRLPYRSDSQPRLMELILEKEAEPPSRFAPGLPEELDRLTLSCLRKNPGERPSARKLARDLERFLGSRKPGKRPGLAPALVGTLVVLPVVAVASLFLTGKQDAPPPDATPASEAAPSRAPSPSPSPTPLPSKLAEAEALCRRALARIDSRDLEGALSDLSSAIEKDPRNARAWTYRGFVRAEKNDFEGAVADATRAILLDPSFSLAWSNRAAARRRQNDLDGAVQDATRSLELEPRNVSSLLTRALALAQKGDREGAIADETRVLEIDPRNFEAHLNRGVFLKSAGRFDEARADFGQAIALEPRDPKPYFSRGKLLAEQNDKAAVPDLERFLELVPPDDGRVPLVKKLLEDLR